MGCKKSLTSKWVRTSSSKVRYFSLTRPRQNSDGNLKIILREFPGRNAGERLLDIPQGILEQILEQIPQ